MDEQNLKLSTADENYDWFQEHLPELVKKYDDRYVVIKNKSVIADYDSFEHALDIAETEEPGTFLIQLCSLDPEKFPHVIVSNLVCFE